MIIIIDNIESWSNPEFIKVGFVIRNGTSEGHKLIDSTYNFTRKITSFYVSSFSYSLAFKYICFLFKSRIAIHSRLLDRPKIYTKILESSTDMCKLFEGKSRDIFLNFMFNVLFPTYGNSIKACPIEKNSYYEYKNISLNSIPLPFG